MEPSTKLAWFDKSIDIRITLYVREYPNVSIGSSYQKYLMLLNVTSP